MSIFSKVSIQEKVDLTKNLAVMLKSGISINEALFAIASQTKPKALKQIITNIKNDVEKGTPLSEAFSKEKNIFDGVFISLVKTGEVSGSMEESLTFLSNWLERNNELKKEISAALFYPKIVLAATLMLGGGLAVFILPKLTPLFSQLKVDLPFTTRAVLAFSNFIEKFWLYTLIAIIGSVVGFIVLNRVPSVKRILHKIYLKLPLFGPMLIDYQLALISQLFSTLFKSGLPISESINIVSEAATNIIYQESLDKIANRVKKGTTLSESMNNMPKLYHPNFINIISVGEKSGSLEESFKYLTEFYSKEVRNKTKRLPTVIEPILLVFIGLIIGVVALSIISPIYELTSGINNL